MNKFINLRVLVADAHAAVCAGVRLALQAAPTVGDVVEARCAEDLANQLDQDHFDILVCELTLLERRDSGVVSLEGVYRRRPATRIVVLTQSDNAGVMHALLTQGVQCIVSKADDLDHLLCAIVRAHAREPYLSPRIVALVQGLKAGRNGLNMLTAREAEVVRMFVSGIGIDEIALRVGRSKKTISTQKGTAMRKLGLCSDIELLRFGMEVGLTEL
ncbi:DNA-binding response regulator [Burkholderia lata]|uniref:DNA-binding response regulator n=1 Tax=Burkholderia lata (strain ATCC 17760 / DSM 23089 / LMG 22485 / NCIMB 9086 / R18194 / 383) TaxID=482957 RepID=A0A6P2X9C4_BURL3|nr:DNA-binding response regulator [Burkholderia lata]